MATATTTLLVQLQTPSGDWVDVGLLRGANETNWFESSQRYWDLPQRPILGQVFEDAGPGWKPSARVALPHWFSHLLPEGRLREAVASAAHLSAKRELSLLERLGADDLPGATRVLLTDEHGESVAPNDQSESEDGDESEPLLKFSLAGLQLKFSIHRTDRALTIPIAGQAGNGILKLPDGRPGFGGVPEAEFAAMSLAREVGIRAPRVELVDAKAVAGLGHWATEAPGLSFLVDRFDRTSDGRRVHAEELAQVINIPTARIDAKYDRANFETIATVVAALAGIEAVGEVIDRIVLNVLIGNGDAHLKNWGFTYDDGQLPRLSPVYDVLPTVLYMQGDDLGLNLNATKRFEAVVPASFERLGERAGYGAARAKHRAAEAVERIMSAWGILADLLPREQSSALTTRLRGLPLARR